MRSSIFLKPVNFCSYRNVENKSRRVPQSTARTRVFYANAFPPCRYEMAFLKKLDNHDRLELIDISAADFCAEEWHVNAADLHRALHILTPAGEWLVGMPSVRHVYREAGLGWLSTISEVPFVAGLLDAAYLRFARNRLKISRWMGVAHPDCSATVCRLQASREKGER